MRWTVPRKPVTGIACRVHGRHGHRQGSTRRRAWLGVDREAGRAGQGADVGGILIDRQGAAVRHGDVGETVAIEVGGRDRPGIAADRKAVRGLEGAVAVALQDTDGP